MPAGFPSAGEAPKTAGAALEWGGQNMPVAQAAGDCGTGACHRPLVVDAGICCARCACGRVPDPAASPGF